jgi:hypothetical protein
MECWKSRDEGNGNFKKRPRINFSKRTSYSRKIFRGDVFSKRLVFPEFFKTISKKTIKVTQKYRESPYTIVL